MKRVYWAVIVGLVAFILVGVFRPNISTWVTDQRASIETKLDNRAFVRHRSRAIRCANDQLEYSRVIGTVRSKKTLMVTVHLLEDFGVVSNKEIFDSYMRQVNIITACMNKYVPDWELVQVFQVEFGALEGYNQAGERAGLISVNLAWVLTLDRETVGLMPSAPNLGELVITAIDDKRAKFLYLGFFTPVPVAAGWVDGKLVVEAATLFVDWNTARVAATE